MKHTCLAVALSGSILLTVSTTSALPLYQHASSFQAARGADQQFISRSLAGVSNSAAVSKTVVSSPPRIPQASGNQTVVVTGWNGSAVTNSRCSIYALNAAGSPVVSKSFCMGAAAGCNVVPPGLWTHSEFFPTFKGPYVVLCTLLPAGASSNRIQGVELRGQ